MEDKQFISMGISNDIKEKMIGNSMKENAIISFDDLRYLNMTYYGFDHLSHIGEMIVHKDVADEVLEIFKILYQHQFPIEKMNLIDKYSGDDILSMEDNNTSGFNYRKIANTDKLSTHSYGKAIDINPVQNPYFIPNTQFFEPKKSKKYIDRTLSEKGMIKENDIVVKTFQKYGWEWGGNWSTPKDYQHFEKQ